MYIKKFLSKVLLSLFLFSYISEFFLILFKSDTLLSQEKKVDAFNLDDRVDYFKKKNLNSEFFFSIPSDYFLKYNHNLIPLSDKSNSNIIFCKKNYKEFSSFNSDRFGFNNPNWIWDKQKIDYIIIGPDIAKGACIDRPNDISSILRKKGIDVLNLGSSLSEPLIWLGILKEYSVNFDFEKIIVIFKEDEIQDLNKEIRHKILKNYLDEDFSQKLKNNQNDINATIDKQFIFFQKKKKTSYEKFIFELKNFLKLKKFRSFFIIKQKNFKQEILNFENVLKKINNFSKKSNAELVILYLPLQKSLINYTNDTLLEIELKRITQKFNIKFFNLKNQINDSKNPDDYFLFPLSKNKSPYSMKGHKMISDFISDNLN